MNNENHLVNDQNHDSLRRRRRDKIIFHTNIDDDISLWRLSNIAGHRHRQRRFGAALFIRDTDIRIIIKSSIISAIIVFVAAANYRHAIIAANLHRGAKYFAGLDAGAWLRVKRQRKPHDGMAMATFEDYY